MTISRKILKRIEYIKLSIFTILFRTVAIPGFLDRSVFTAIGCRDFIRNERVTNVLAFQGLSVCEVLECFPDIPACEVNLLVGFGIFSNLISILSWQQHVEHWEISFFHNHIQPHQVEYSCHVVAVISCE